MTEENKPMEANIEDLRKYSVLVATPAYGGSIKTQYMTGMLGLQRQMDQLGIKFNFFCLTGESLIPRGRNSCANFFWKKTDFTHLLFIDADIGFDPKHVIEMLIVYHNDPEKYKLTSVAYPRKAIAWEKIRLAVEAGVGQQNPMELENYVGDMVFNLIPGKDYPINQPIPLRHTGTGFMMIHRSVLDTFAEKYPHRRYISDMSRTAEYGEEHVMFFNSEIDEETRHYLSEDYLFCKHCSEFGVDPYVLPWLNLDHIGEFAYKGNLAAITSIGASALIDADTAQQYVETLSKKMA